MSPLEGFPEVSCGIVILVDFAKWFSGVQDLRQSKKMLSTYFSHRSKDDLDDDNNNENDKE